MEEEWVNLNGFKKSSSIARGDHFWIEKKLRERFGADTLGTLHTEPVKHPAPAANTEPVKHPGPAKTQP